MAESSDAEQQHELIEQEPITTEEIDTPQPAPRGRGRRKKSVVWEHFTIEPSSGGTARACCNLCKQTFAYSSGSKVAGTSHLKRHIVLGSCPMIKSRERGDRTLALPSSGPTPTSDDGTLMEPPTKRRYRISGFANSSFDHDLSLTNLAKLVILHDYPLHIVEQPGFASFVESLQPRFRVTEVSAMQAEVLNIYHREKQHLMQVFSSIPGRISLTIGLWTTSHTLGYVALYGQFIDSDWRLHRRMLNFLMVTSPHSENALSEAIGASLSDWNMSSKLFTITLDNNCSSHDIYSVNLRDHLSNKNALMLKGQLFVVRCYAHILNMVAQDVTASIHGIIYNIRESVKFVKASPSREEKFAEIALQLEIPSTRTLSLDTTTQWNTTYMMLLAALEYKQAFNLLETCDDNYNEAPSTDDWRKVEVVCAFLKLLYDSANAVTATAEVTSNVFFHEAWKIQLELSNAVQSEDPVVSEIARDMHDKFDKYWKDCSLVLAIAVVMDPRFKMRLVEFSFNKIYGQDAPRYVQVVDDTIHELYNEYIAQPLPLTPAFEEQQHLQQQQQQMEPKIESHSNMGENGGESNTDQMIEAAPMEEAAMSVEIETSNGVMITHNQEDHGVSNNTVSNSPPNASIPSSTTGDGLLDFDLYLSEMAVKEPMKPELEMYLEEPLHPRVQEFDILHWWKLNSLKYPNLCKMARDVLGIPMSMAGAGSGLSVFGTGSGSKMLDEYRSSLNPEILEAITCAKDWLLYHPMSAAEPGSGVKMEY